MNHSDWKIRNAVEEDLAFIYSTWGNAMRYGSALGKGVRNAIFFPYFTQVIDRILSQDDTVIQVACQHEDENIIFGYIVSQNNLLHFVFVKEAFWDHGIARSLYEKAAYPKTVTHRTVYSDPILKSHPELTYNPFLLFNRGEPNG